jgi:OmpA-OmpF porin, OOP family
MHHRFVVSFFVIAASFLHVTAGLAADKPGSKDHPLIKRYEGSSIFQYSRQDFGQYKLALGKALNPYAGSSQGKTIDKEEAIEGRVTRISYLAPAGRSALEVFRNYQQELTNKGFATLFTGETDALGFMFCKRYEGLYSQIFEYNNEGSCYLAARLERPEGNVTVAIFVTEFQNGLTGSLTPVKGQGLVQVDVIEDKPMEEHMVTVSAEKMATGIESTGHVALYGIFFDFNKADLKPESAPTLEQIAILLRNNAQMKLLVVGHTDNVGAFDYNQTLSKRRAAAVATELTSRYGVSTSRLHPVGAGCIAPVATNHTEEGRAKNRRVELVEE